MATHGTATEQQQSHANICIKRVIGGEEIFFVGFIREDDADGYVLGEVMLERVRDAGFVPLDNSSHLEEHMGKWAYDKELAHFYVVTGERLPEDSRSFRCFYRGGRERCWGGLGGRFSRGGLVACRAQ